MCHYKGNGNGKFQVSQNFEIEWNLNDASLIEIYTFFDLEEKKIFLNEIYSIIFSIGKEFDP